MDALNILVVDAQPATALLVMDALRDLGHRAEIQSGGLGAINAVTTKRRANRPYQLVVANFELADIDPVEFLHSLRQHREMLPVCFYAHTHKLPREAFSAVEQLDGRFISLPIDRKRIETLVEEVIRGARRATETGGPGGESPFFGTGRVTRRSSSLTDSVPRPATAPIEQPAARPISESIPKTARPISESIPKHAPPLPPSSDLPPVTTSISRRSTEVPASPFPDDAPASPVLRGTAQFHNDQARYMRTPLPGSVTSPSTDPFVANVPRTVSLTERHRRSITGQQSASSGGTNPAAPGQQQPGTGSIGAGTSRIRRSITGKVVNPDLQQAMSTTGQAKVATCSSCGKEFYAELRADAYSLPCLYCGQMNRIEPA